MSSGDIGVYHRKVLKSIIEHPGSKFKKIMRLSGLSFGEVKSILYYLSRSGFIMKSNKSKRVAWVVNKEKLEEFGVVF